MAPRAKFNYQQEETCDIFIGNVAKTFVIDLLEQSDARWNEN